jgi:Ankyrin repeats (3 copies)
MAPLRCRYEGFPYNRRRFLPCAFRIITYTKTRRSTNTKGVYMDSFALKQVLDSADRGDIEIFNRWSKGIGLRAVRDEYGNTPLHLATTRGRLSFVHHLLSLGKVDINAQNVHGETALHEAARAGNTLIVQTLLGAGADPMVHSISGALPLNLAMSRGEKAWGAFSLLQKECQKTKEQSQRRQ